MGADVSRMRFDPLKDFGGLALQQGRLLLDADFNEYVAMLDRRLRAETSDLTSFGPDPDHAGVAWVPRLTPDAFRISATGGDLTIGRGRMYVDGLLAENHGTEPFGFDELLSGRIGTADTTYDEQPYWLTPDPLPPGGPHLAYLDVWQREVTHLEDPGLVEIAVGVDTAARLQTVWQVRLLPDVGGGACTADDADLPGWLDVIRPSAGRLTTDTIDIDPTEDPCELPPSGGYRGLENQTYRVEIHDGGEPDAATFKWSRDNGSVAMAVVEMVSPTELTLASLGRDDVLRISTGDWVEILDDHRELNQLPGEMRKVTVDDATRTITFAGGLPADLQPADADELAGRHFRVRRWDQAGTVTDATGATLENLDDAGSDGLITVPGSSATQVVLEHGIVVSLSIDGAGGEFRGGDYWVFAARTADTSVEILDEAPPRGVHHHYARLGTITFPDGETDCRRLWPPLDTGGEGCDCTVCITPESHASGALTLQAAVDSIGETGGTICLAPGIYDLGDGVSIDRARSLRIRGQGVLTVLVASGTAITVTSSFGITVENLSVIAGVQSSGAIAMRNVVGVTVQDTAILSYGNPDIQSAAVELSNVAFAVAIRRNVLIGQVGVDGAGQGEVGVLAADLSIEDNIVGGLRGVDLGGRSLYFLSCRVGRNELVTVGGDAIAATGLAAPGGTLDITANNIVTNGTGVRVGTDALVSDNSINSIGEQLATDGIVATVGGLGGSPGHVRIVGNRIHGLQGRAIALEGPVRTFMVKQNIITDVGAGIVMDARAEAENVAVDNNVVSGVRRSELTGGVSFGIALTNARRVDLATNRVSEVGLDLVEGTARAGILTVGCEDVRVAGNVVSDVGPPDGFVGLAAGVAVVGPYRRATAAENSLSFAGGGGAPEEGSWVALLLASATSGLATIGPRSAIAIETGAFVLTDGWGFAVEERGDHCTVSDNTLDGGMRLPTCLVDTNGDVVANANQCAHVGGEEVGMLLAARSVAAASNRVRGGGSMLVIQTEDGSFSAVGNLAAGGTHLGGPGGGLPAPWDVLNPIVP